MNKELAWGICIIAVVVIAIVAYNSTITGQSISEHRIISEGKTGEVEFNGVIYTISDVQVSRTGLVSFTITNNNLVQSSQRIENVAEGIKLPVSKDIGQIKVLITNAVHNAQQGKSFIEVVLYPK